MKHIPTTLLPALALLTLGGCATTNGLTTTEPDGIYYSSKDRTTAVATVATAEQAADYAATDDPNAVANPDYQDGRSQARGSASDEYYDEDFDYAYYARQRRYNGLGMGYGLSYVDPFWYRPTFVYNDPFLYSPYGGYAYSGWYDPFWGPSWYGPAVSLNIGWGWGGWGPYGRYYGYRPYGYGYGNGFYDGYYAGLYGGGYYGGYWNGYRGGSRAVDYNRVTPRRRQDRGVQVVGANPNGGGGRARVPEATGGRAATYSNGSTDPTPRYRGRVEGVSQSAPVGQTKPEQAVSEAPAQQPGRGRIYRIQENANVNATEPDQTGGYKPQRARLEEQAAQPAPQPATEAQPEYQPKPRRQRYVDYGSQQSQQAEPTRREQSYEPQPSRSYEQPSRGNGGSNYGGGSNNGGGRGRVR